MKKYFTVFVSFILILCLSGCTIADVAYLYTAKGEMDGFDIAVNKFANCCFVGYYNCTEYTENMEITIPDEFVGFPITRIGGAYGRGLPSPFHISLADLYMNAPEGSLYNAVFYDSPEEYTWITDKYAIQEVPFTLRIGKRIETIKYIEMDCYYPHINEDESITFYHPVVYIICSEENPYFYSKDGKLYDKETDELITDFAYAES